VNFPRAEATSPAEKISPIPYETPE